MNKIKVSNVKKLRNHLLNSSDKSKRLRVVFIGIVILLLVILFIQFWVLFFSTSVPSIYNSPVFHHNPSDGFADFFNVNYFVMDMSPYDHGSSYPPFALIPPILFAPLQHLEKLAVLIYFIVMLIPIFFLSLKAKKKFGISNACYVFLIVCSFLSAPMLFLIERGNYLLINMLFIGFFLVYYDDKKRINRNLALFFLGCAMATRMYPAVFAVLLLKKKRYVDVVKAGLCAVILTMVSFSVFKGGPIYNIKLFLENLRKFSNYEPLSLNVSLNNAFRITCWLITGNISFSVNSSIMAVIIISGAVSILSCFLCEKKWQVVCLCSLLTITIPTAVMIHTLVIMFFPISMFLYEQKRSKLDYLYMCLFLAIIIPFQFGWTSYEGYYLGLSVSNIIECYAVVILLLALNMEILISSILKRARSRSSREDKGSSAPLLERNDL